MRLGVVFAPGVSFTPNARCGVEGKRREAHISLLVRCVSIVADIDELQEASTLPGHCLYCVALGVFLIICEAWRVCSVCMVWTFVDLYVCYGVDGCPGLIGTELSFLLGLSILRYSCFYGALKSMQRTNGAGRLINDIGLLHCIDV